MTKLSKTENPSVPLYSKHCGNPVKDTSKVKESERARESIQNISNLEAFFRGTLSHLPAHPIRENEEQLGFSRTVTPPLTHTVVLLHSWGPSTDITGLTQLINVILAPKNLNPHSSFLKFLLKKWIISNFPRDGHRKVLNFSEHTEPCLCLAKNDFTS